MLVRKFIFTVALCGAAFGVPSALAQTKTPQPTQKVNAGVKSANDSVANKVQQADKDLQKQTDKINKKIEKITSKADEKIEKVDSKLSSASEKLKAATIKKNTRVMRAYHNLTAYYNVYFNANDSYKEGLKKAAKDYPFDYMQVLPIFPFEAKEIPAMVTAEMARTLEKSDKTIKKHSITNKPELKKGKRLTKEEQEFYNRREFCRSIDDAYLLIGKANIYLHEYDLALLAFDHVMVEYPYEPTIYEARIWSAVVAGAKDEVSREREILTALLADKKFPPKYAKLLNEANADLLIREKKYKEAIPKVEKAIKSTRGVNRQRYHFILGQLYQQTGNAKKAIAHYTSVIRRMPSYDLEFHARLNKAFLSVGRKGEGMRKMLLKMAKDEKNKEYLDMIYYALAEMEMNAKRTGPAIAYYKLSAASSKGDSPQRVRSCLMLAKYFEAQGSYEEAQAYYDSTAMVMPKTNPEYEMVSSKAQNLGKLAANLRIIKTEDSLQHIARMSLKEREKYVTAQIALAKANEEKRLRDEEARAAREEVASTAATAMATFAQPTSGKWYFYNPQLISSGAAEFRKKWGQRKLTDNWRRESKGFSADFAMPSGNDNNNNDDNGEEKSAAEQPNIPENQTEAYYLANVPLTDSLMEASNKRVVEAMFDAAMVYKDYIRDNPNAVSMLEALLKRYPTNRYRLEAIFYLYVLNSEADNATRADHYKNLLFAEYPDELLTMYVKDPTYVSDKEAHEKAANKLFGNAYDLYQAGKYGEAAHLSQQGLAQYAEMSIAANFRLLNVMATGSNGDIGRYIAGLGEVAKEYPNTETAKAAQEMLSIVQKRELTLISEREAPPPEAQAAPSVPYSDEDGESFLALVVGKDVNINQLKFNFISFNADIDADELTIDNRTFGDGLTILVVGKFNAAAEAVAYYKKVKAYPAIFRDLNMESYSMFAITAKNLELLERSRIVSAYNTFFQLNVLKEAE
ncbi:MAG: tetratricopeptide repeat protein [Prevotellaceae bacterium]|nr:tetratricopeptide repeat protein [Prevotellaceae bacterium]